MLDQSDAELIARAVAQAVAEAIGNLTLSVDGAALGYVTAEAINENRRADGRVSLEL